MEYVNVNCPSHPIIPCTKDIQGDCDCQWCCAKKMKRQLERTINRTTGHLFDTAFAHLNAQFHDYELLP